MMSWFRLDEPPASAGDQEATSKRVGELEHKLKSQQDDAVQKLKEARGHEDALIQDEKLQVEHLLALAHVVGGNLFVSLTFG